MSGPLRSIYDRILKSKGDAALAILSRKGKERIDQLAALDVLHDD